MGNKINEPKVIIKNKIYIIYFIAITSKIIRKSGQIIQINRYR